MEETMYKLQLFRMITDAYNLPAKKVIHIVGPIVANGLNF